MKTNNFENLGLSSVDVARAIRFVAAEKKGFSVNMTQIHKLMYILYGLMLVRRKERLTKEHPCAWPYGPVFPIVHERVKLSDNISMDEYANLESTNKELATLIDNVVERFGRLSASKLTDWSHRKNSPWDLAVKDSNGKWNTELNDENIYNYFYSFVNI